MEKNKLIKTYFWNAIGIGFNSIYSIVITLFLTRASSDGLTVAGQFSYAFYVGALLSTIGCFGGRILQISDSRKRFSDSDYISLRYIANLIMICICIFFVIVNGYSFEKMGLIFLMILYRAVESISDSYYGIMQNNNDLVRVGISTSLKSVLSIILFIIIFTLTNNVIASSISFVFSFLFVFFIYDKNVCKKKYNLNKVKVKTSTFLLMKKSFKVFLFSFLILLIANITRYFVDLRLSDDSQGLFTIIILPASLVVLFSQFLIQPLLKKIIDSYNNKEFSKFKKMTIYSILVLLFSGCIIASIMYMWGTNLLELIYGVNLTDFKFIIFILVIAGILNGSLSLTSNYLTIMGKQTIQIYLFLIPIIVCVIVFIFMINSLLSALWGYVLLMVTEFITFIIYFLFSLKKLK